MMIPLKSINYSEFSCHIPRGGGQSGQPREQKCCPERQNPDVQSYKRKSGNSSEGLNMLLSDQSLVELTN